MCGWAYTLVVDHLAWYAQDPGLISGHHKEKKNLALYSVKARINFQSSVTSFLVTTHIFFLPQFSYWYIRINIEPNP
jgi:hypothetical protein